MREFDWENYSYINDLKEQATEYARAQAKIRADNELIDMLVRQRIMEWLHDTPR